MDTIPCFVLIVRQQKALLEQLHTSFASGQALALTQSYTLSGLGGIGKTQVALEYAYRYHM